MNPSEKDYQTEDITMGNMDNAKIAVNKLAYTQEQIEEHINKEPPEKRVARRLFIYGIREDEYLKMRENIELDFPAYLNIANHLRDFWRKKK